jgi:hypothetical protein
MTAQIDGERTNAVRRETLRDRFPIPAGTMKHVHEDHRGAGARRRLVPRRRQHQSIVGAERDALGRRHRGVVGDCQDCQD